MQIGLIRIQKIGQLKLSLQGHQHKLHSNQHMDLAFLQKIKKARADALSNNRIVRLLKEDLTKTSIFVEGKLSYTWYQTDQRVGIDIPYSLDNKDSLKTDFKEHKATVEFTTMAGHFNLELELYGSIVPEGSKSIVHLNRIEIQMEKVTKNHLWPRLQKTETTSSTIKESHIPQYPTSSTTKKDWGKLEKEIVNESEKNKDDGQDPASQLFKQIYQGADEEKRRAMIKSFQTSGGTVLSTDWNDVKGKDYEGKDRPSPPKGQQWVKDK